MLSALACLLLAAPAASADHGKLPWFEGGYLQLLQAAAAAKKPVLIDFWTSWCGWCKRLDRDTFSDAGVVEELADFVVWNVDAESPEGRRLCQIFKVSSYPALIVLEPDGAPRDRIDGYLAPAAFRNEIQRIRRGEGTLDGYRRRIAADPRDLEARLGLARKLELFGERAGHEAELDAIERLDPRTETLAGEHVRLEREKAGILEHWQRTKQIDTAGLEAFLRQSKHGEVRFAGWAHVAGTRHREAQQLAGRVPEQRLRTLQQLSRAAYGEAWKACPPAQRAAFGKELAQTFCQQPGLAPQDKAFALEVARAAAAAAPEDPPVLHALAMCLKQSGELDEARRTIERCRELEPENPAWERAAKELGGAR